MEKQDWTAQEISQSALYSPGPREYSEALHLALDEERKLIAAAFQKIEQGTGMPVIYGMLAANISVGALPGALVFKGLGFGTDISKLFLEVGTATSAAIGATAGLTDTTATFNLAGVTGLAAGRVVNIRILKVTSATKMVRSEPISVSIIA